LLSSCSNMAPTRSKWTPSLGQGREHGRRNGATRKSSSSCESTAADLTHGRGSACSGRSRPLHSDQRQALLTCNKKLPALIYPWLPKTHGISDYATALRAWARPCQLGTTQSGRGCGRIGAINSRANHSSRRSARAVSPSTPPPLSPHQASGALNREDPPARVELQPAEAMGIILGCRKGIGLFEPAEARNDTIKSNTNSEP
jgi:hypothetical protein